MVFFLFFLVIPVILYYAWRSAPVPAYDPARGVLPETWGRGIRMKGGWKDRTVTLKTMPLSERPYERMESLGAPALSDAELLAVIIKNGTKEETAVEVARQLLCTCGEKGLLSLQDKNLEELMQIRGIGKVKAIQLKAVCELCIRMAGGRQVAKTKVQSFAQVAEMFLLEFSTLQKEVFRVVLLDKKWQIVKVSDISVGTLDQALVHPREVFTEAIRNTCSAVILVHNHPSGDVEPSRQDIETTARLVCVGDIVGIEIVDHIIIGNGTFSSMYLSGYMDKIRQEIMRRTTEL